jgi:hypothetical protein
MALGPAVLKAIEGAAAVLAHNDHVAINAAFAPRGKAPVAVQLGLIRPVAALRQLANLEDLHRLDERRLNAFRSLGFLREHGHQIRLTGGNRHRNRDKCPVSTGKM